MKELLAKFKAILRKISNEVFEVVGPLRSHPFEDRDSVTTLDFRKHFATLPAEIQEEAMKLLSGKGEEGTLVFNQLAPDLPYYSLKFAPGYYAISCKDGTTIQWVAIMTGEELEKLGQSYATFLSKRASEG